MERKHTCSLVVPFLSALLFLAAPGARAEANPPSLCTVCNAGANHPPACAAPGDGIASLTASSGATIPVVPAPRNQQYPRSGPAREAKAGVSLASDETVSLTLVVTAASVDHFYGQLEGGFWGVRVDYPGHGFVEDEKVTVRGLWDFTTGEGEVSFHATEGTAVGMQPMEPVTVSNRAVAGSHPPSPSVARYTHPPVEGGAGMGAAGMLLSTGGIVTSVSPEGTFMTISDGSAWGPDGLHDPEGNAGLRVFLEEGPLPPVGTYVQAKGVGSYYDSGGLYYPSVKSKPPWINWKWTTKIRVHFIRVHDDDGGRPADITPSQAANLVTNANTILAQTNVTLLYDSANDFSDFNSTMLNNMSGSKDPDWAQSSGLANFVASFFYSGKMVVFVRQAGGGFSWWDLNFVAMPSFYTYHCGTLNSSLFAHEIGHYLGLWHTFPTDPFVDVAAAEQYFVNNGKNPAIFDGDGLPDTLPDPGIRTLECGSTSSVTLAGVTFQLPRENLMSYYKDADTLSTLQRQRLHWTLWWRAGNKMPSPRNEPYGSGIVEAENMIFTTHVDCPFGVQWMTPWGSEHWSNGRQVFGGCSKGGEISFPFQVAQPGYYTLAAYMTHAPDFGVVQFYVDGKSTGSVFDGYGALVVPSGRRQLGKKLYLSAGGHTIKAKVTGKNDKSSNYYMGVDCFQIN